MSVIKEQLLNAIDLALNDQWDAAHGIVQKHEGDATADWIHAALHKIEGDASNSHYWYRRAGRMEHAQDEPRTEFDAIRSELTP